MADTADTDGRGRGVRKSATAYRTISEVSDDLGVPQHVLRFWETKFSQVRPLKRGGGRRYYRPEDVLLLRRIQKLLYEDGFTIKGVQKLLREGKSIDDVDVSAVSSGAQPPQLSFLESSAAEPASAGGQPTLAPELRSQLTDLLAELRALRDALRPGKG